jgi:magnesium transporter
MVYYSQLIGKWIIDSNQNKIGKVKDFCIIDGVRYATIQGIVLYVEGELKVINWRYVSEIGEKSEDTFPFSVYLNRAGKKIKYEVLDKPVLNEIIDKQIIDVSGARIVRVNDILLGKVGKKFAVIGVSTSSHGLFRRMGLSMLVGNKKEHIIMWKDVAPLSKKIKTLKVKIKRDRLNELHAAEIADLIRDLSLEEKVMVFNSLTKEKAAKTLLIANPDVQKTVFKTLSLKQIAIMLEEMSTHDAAAMLNMMPTVNNNRVLRLMKPGIAGKIKTLLNYEPRTAGALMSTRFIKLPDYFTVEQAIGMIKDMNPKTRHSIYLYVVDIDGKLLGVVSLKMLVMSNKEDKVSDLVKTDIQTVLPKTEINDVFNIMSKYDLLILPVVDKSKKILGVIRMHDLFQMIVPQRIKQQRILKNRKRLDKNGNSTA